MSSRQRRVIVFLNWKLMSPSWREIVTGFQTLPFFFLSFQSRRLFFNHVSPLRLPNSWQSIVLAQSYPLLLEKSSAWQPVLSLTTKSYPRSNSYMLWTSICPPMGISVCPAPGRSHPMSVALHNLQAPSCAVTHQLQWSLCCWSCWTLGLEGLS